MSKSEYLRRLSVGLSSLSEEQRRRQLDYYSELFDGMLSQGMTEAEVAARLGDPYELAQSIVERGGRPRRSKSSSAAMGVGIALIVLSLVIGAFSVFGGNMRGITHTPVAPEPDYPAVGEYSGWQYNAAGEYAVSAEGISGIDVNWVAGEAEIALIDGEQILFSEKGFTSADNALRWTVSGGRLSIDYCEPHNRSYKGADKRLTLYVPASVAELCLNSASGDFSLRGLSLSELYVDSASGDFEAEQCSFGSVRADVTSGDLSLECSVAAADINTVSGEIELHGSADALDISTVSGEVELLLNIAPQSVEVETVSGEVKLELPPDCGFQLIYNTTSGTLSGSYPNLTPTYKKGNEATAINITTVSGDLELGMWK